MDKFFKISERGSDIKTEIIAGLTTFFAMAYIVVVNPNQVTGFTPELGQIWNAVYVASILVAVIGTLLMAFLARMPYAQACGMGLNSFFFVCFVLPEVLKGAEGNPVLGYQAGCVIILLEGVIFLLLSATGVRQAIAKALPDCLKKAIPAGIGLFIAFIGFQNVGLIQANQYTFVQFFDFHGALTAAPGPMEAWTAIAPVVLTFLGLITIGVLNKKNVKGSIIITIIAVTVLYYLSTWTLPNFDFSQIGASFQDFAAIGITGLFSADPWLHAFGGFADAGLIVNAVILIIVFCLVDMFDTLGTLYGAASEAGLIDENNDPIDVDKCMLCDSIATVCGGIFGTSTCTTFVESSAGVAAGGRTGLASVVTAICFALCLFLTPLASIVPSCATAPALIFVGVLMCKNIMKVDMVDMQSAIPAFLALIMMPLTYSIANGIGIGAIAYTLITLFTGKYTKRDIIVTIIAILFIFKFVFVTM